jgi:CSLREA domain-containing protein
MHRPSQTSLLLSLLALAACSEDQPSTGPSGPAFGSTAVARVVNSLADPGNGACNAAQCTLREAIEDPASTVITFAPGLTGTITLAAPAAGGGTLGIDKQLSITGPASGIVIQRRTTDPAFRIFRVGSAGNLTLTNLTVQRGQADRGGGIINFGTLELGHVFVTENSTSGIDNHGVLTLRGASVDHNAARGIDNHSNGSLTLRSSAVALNGEGGISNDGGSLTLENSTVTQNAGSGVVAVRGTTTIATSRIAGNNSPTLGGGILAFQADVSLTNSTVANNSATDGGGIANRDGSTFTITKSTINGNTATDQGGGIFNRVQVRVEATVTLTNTTVSGNLARSGGGIYNTGFLALARVTLRNSTVVRNRASNNGGGIRQEFDEAALDLINTIVAENQAPVVPEAFNDEESSVFARFSLIRDGRGSGVSNTDGNQVGMVSPRTTIVNPAIGMLEFNGGPTKTHELHGSSPAVDAGSDADCPATDQRGVTRPQRAHCDIGSFELE